MSTVAQSLTTHPTQHPRPILRSRPLLVQVQEVTHFSNTNSFQPFLHSPHRTHLAQPAPVGACGGHRP